MRIALPARCIKKTTACGETTTLVTLHFSHFSSLPRGDLNPLKGGKEKPGSPYPGLYHGMYQREQGMKTFAEKAYDILRKVPEGRVTTYKEIARALGTRAYRTVGQAMKRNPYAPEVP